ncbi:MAG: hemerythrin domain-containing protein [Nitrospira sp.]|nr:hemerythrin domain-containing protein [Nitrospira sp.]MBH0190033.1 hemerythrin domain-containing protein [Nitrospira sp.]MBH0197691.1 hemerythrin domain-containing protein [Nitrospira sp.]
MEERGQGRQGPISEFLMEDHRRLDGLLQSTAADSCLRDDATYHQFRAGLLRYIGIEEKILLPAVQRLRGGTPLPVAAQLRLDHGALAALLMPTPTISIMAMIQTILEGHNMIEEGPDGLYEMCDLSPPAERERLLTVLRAVPPVGVMPYSDTPAVMGVIQRAVVRAGYEFKE